MYTMYHTYGGLKCMKVVDNCLGFAYLKSELSLEGRD